jgi:dienelactone hydrolase
LVTVVSFLTWFHIVFAAERDATLEVFRDDGIQVTEVEGSIVMEAADGRGETGILYFPGARVNPYSYLYPLSEIAASGVTVVIMDPLMNMALFDTRSVEELALAAPEVNDWVLSGHSLGGVRACMLAQHPDVVGLVLMGSYCATDISALDIPMLQVLASKDGLIDTEAVSASASLLPDSARTIMLEGASHASFGTYGDQPGDGTATLNRAEVREALTALFQALLAGD